MQIKIRGGCRSTMEHARSRGLYYPPANVLAGMELMHYWRAWCTSQRHDHHWLYHYNQGFGTCPVGTTECLAADRQVAVDGRYKLYVESILRTRTIWTDCSGKL